MSNERYKDYRYRYKGYRYRHHAIELRTLAATTESEADRVTLLKLADEYEAMARTMEAVERTSAAMQKINATYSG